MNTAAATSILAAVCPNQCSSQGQCNNGTCICNPPYTGDDCSFNPTAPISLIIPVNNGLCDMRASNCAVAQMLGTGFVPSVTTCLIQPVVVGATGVTVAGQSSNLGTAIFISPSEVHCVLSTPSSAYVQLTNSPSNSSNSSITPSSPLFIVYDSVCFTCLAANNGTGPSCTQMSTACVIDGVCYGSGAQNPQNSCQICQPTQSISSFSLSDACTSQAPPAAAADIWNPLGLIIGLTVGLSALVAIVIGLTSWICIKYYHTKSKNLILQANRQQNSQGSFYRTTEPPPQYHDTTYTNETFKPVA